MNISKHLKVVESWKRQDDYISICSKLLRNVCKEESDFLKNAVSKATPKNKKKFCIEHGLLDDSDRSIVNHRLDMIAQFKLDHLMSQDDKSLMELAKTSRSPVSALILEAKFGAKLSKSLKLRKIQLMELENEISC